jgi:hypothetical protein
MEVKVQEFSDDTDAKPESGKKKKSKREAFTRDEEFDAKLEKYR